jgi:hypothetical protein
MDQHVTRSKSLIGATPRPRSRQARLFAEFEPNPRLDRSDSHLAPSTPCAGGSSRLRAGVSAFQARS